MPSYDPYEDDSGEDYSTTCSFSDDSDEELEAMDKLRWTIELAKADCLGTMDYNAEKFLKDTRRDAEKRFDKLYTQIKQKFQIKKKYNPKY